MLTIPQRHPVRLPAPGLHHGGEINVKRQEVLCRANADRVSADTDDVVFGYADVPSHASKDISHSGGAQSRADPLRYCPELRLPPWQWRPLRREPRPRVTTPDHCSTILATRISRIRCDIPTWHRINSKDSGGTELITPKTGRSGADWLDPHHRLEGEVVTRWSLKVSDW